MVKIKKNIYKTIYVFIFCILIMNADELRKRLSDPNNFGPIMWYLIHNLALKLSQNNFIIVFYIIIDLIPCNTCKNHAKKYLSENPLELYKDIYHESSGELIGMFKWTWAFHNNVNQRLNKPLLDFNVAYKMYQINNYDTINEETIELCNTMCTLAS